MNKIKLLHLVILLTFPFLGLTQINIQWQTDYDDASGIDQAVGIVVDGAGNSYITGTSYNGSNFDIITIKYDINGTEQWTARYDGLSSSVDEAKAIALGPNNEVYVLGHSFVSPTDQDIVTIKYNPTTGAEEWSNEFTGTANYDLAGDIVVDGNNNIYVTGTRDHVGSFRVTTIKYNSAGIEQWNDTYNHDGNGIHFGRKITVDASNNVYVLCEVESSGGDQDVAILRYNSGSTGVSPDWSESYDADGNNDLPQDIHVSNGFVYATGGSLVTDIGDKENYYVLKAASNTGALVWDRLMNGSGSDTDIAYSVITDANDHVYITGSSIGDTTAQDMLTVGYDNNGNLKWTHTYASSGAFYDVGNELILGTSGDIYASGTSYKAGQSNDYLTLKFNSDGNLLWETRFNGPANNSDNAIGMYVDPAENIYITGKSKAPSTNFDYRTIKYCQLTTTASNDTAICVGETVTLNATGGSNETWTVLSGDNVNISCTSCASPVVTPNTTTVYTVSTTSGSGCVDYDTVTVTINPLPGPSIFTDGPTEFCVGDSVRLYTQGFDAYEWNDVDMTTDSFIVVHTSGTFTVTVEDVMGCQNSTNQVVTVNTLPSIEGGADHAICIGDSTQLDANGGDSYLWVYDPTIDDHADPMTWVYPTSTTTYEVVGTDINGCKDTGDITITVNPLPADFDLVVQDDTMIVSIHTFGNTWYFDGIEQTGITGNEIDFCDDAFGPGDYWITYTDANNCQINSDTVTFTESDTTLCWDTIIGINPYTDIEEYIHVYPNPTRDIVKITFGNQIPESMVVIGMDGRTILTRSNITYIEEIDLTNTENGTYFVIFQFENGSIARRKLVKQ